MSYAEGRVIHDADSHVVETPGWLEPYADPAVRDRLGGPLLAAACFANGGAGWAGAAMDRVPAAAAAAPLAG